MTPSNRKPPYRRARRRPTERSTPISGKGGHKVGKSAGDDHDSKSRLVDAVVLSIGLSAPLEDRAVRSALLLALTRLDGRIARYLQTA